VLAETQGMRKFYKQGTMGKWDCFPVAIMNYQVYNSYPVSKKQLSRLCNCDNGISHTDKIIKQLGLPLTPTRVLGEVIDSNGVITIEHPLYGLHSVFVFNQNNKIYMVNSLLGNLVAEVKRSQLLKLLPKDKKGELWSG
jgi:hypothetical protein